MSCCHEGGGALSVAHLGHDDNLLARELQLLDSVAQNDLRKAVGVAVGGVERLNA